MGISRCRMNLIYITFSHCFYFLIKYFYLQNKQQYLLFNFCKSCSFVILFFPPMKQINKKKQSMSKAFRFKPQDYLSNTFYKRGKTFFNSQAKEATIDPYRKTDGFAKTKNMREFILRGSPSPAHCDNERIKRRKGSGSKGLAFRIEKSPYMSNTTEIQKMLKLLIPVKGPNESLKLQIKRHNELNFRNAQLLIVKRSQNFEDRMKAYSSRMGLPEDTKIYTINSRDAHIKAALNRRGWIQSTQKGSILFHLKWVYKDDINDYQVLQQGQFYNHFRNNQELTNKNNLRKNIKKCKIQQRPRFPLSYDIELNEDNLSFQQAFIKFQAFKLLNNIGKYLSNKFFILYSKVQKNSLYFENHNQKSLQSSGEMNFKLLYTRTQSQIRQEKSLLEGYNYLFEYICILADQISKQKHIHYSIFKSKKQNKDMMRIIKKIEEQFVLGAQFLFKDLSQFYIVEILKMWHHSQQIYSNYGVQNMWIVKPTGVSRGSGITITNDCNKIIQLRYGKIVQKYIQFPLLLDCKRKFDIRQWVLVTNFHPLRAYAFRHCYGRFSSQKYSNDKYQNMQKHLTNYSQNKESYLRQKLHLKDNLSKANLNYMSAMAQEDLAYKIGQKWQYIKQEFYEDIIKTLNCCRSDIVQKQGCFQVYGFDIIIDQNYQPYILQVNLSPACQQRQFLHQYLQDMADGVVNMIEGGDPLNWIQLKQRDHYDSKDLKQIEQKVVFIQRWWKKKLKVFEKRRNTTVTEL